MDINSLNTQKINWDSLTLNELKGTTGSTLYKETVSGGIRIRLAEYSAGYSSAEQCSKGHIIHCLSGELTLHTEGEIIKLSAGDSLLLGSASPHTASTGSAAAKIFIIDQE